MTKRTSKKAQKGNVKDKHIKKIMPKKKPPKSEKENTSMFKCIEADRIKDKLKLRQFIDWYALPKDERRPKTHLQFCDVFGVSKDTLTDWKKLPKFYDELKLVRDVIFRKYSSDVFYGGLVRSAKMGNPKAAEIFAKMFEGFSEKLRVEDETPQKTFTQEEKDQIAHALKNIGLAEILKINSPDDNEE